VLLIDLSECFISLFSFNKIAPALMVRMSPGTLKCALILTPKTRFTY